jgi:hypothetical protein
VTRLIVILSDFINYFAPLSHGERTSITQDQVWSGLQGHRRLARAAKKRILECQISEDTQVEQNELLTCNICKYIEKGTISLIRTPTAEMVADSFTKSLPRALLLQHNNDMGLCNVPTGHLSDLDARGYLSGSTTTKCVSL